MHFFTATLLVFIKRLSEAATAVEKVAMALCVLMIVLNFAFAGVGAMAGDTGQGGLVKRGLSCVGWLIVTSKFSYFAKKIVEFFIDLGLGAVGSMDSAAAITSGAALLDPSKILELGLKQAEPVATMMDAFGIMTSPGYLFTFLACWLVMIVGYCILAAQCFMAVLEYYAFLIFGSLMAAFGAFPATRFLAEKDIGLAFAHALKLAMLAVMVSLGSGLVGKLALEQGYVSTGEGASGAADAVATVVLGRPDAVVLGLAVILYVVMAVTIPKLVAGRLAGSPSLSMGEMVSTAATGARILMAATSMGGSAVAGAAKGAALAAKGAAVGAKVGAKGAAGLAGAVVGAGKAGMAGQRAADVAQGVSRTPAGKLAAGAQAFLGGAALGGGGALARGAAAAGGRLLMAKVAPLASTFKKGAAVGQRAAAGRGLRDLLKGSPEQAAKKAGMSPIGAAGADAVKVAAIDEGAGKGGGLVSGWRPNAGGDGARKDADQSLRIGTEAAGHEAGRDPAASQAPATQSGAPQASLGPVQWEPGMPDKPIWEAGAGTRAERPKVPPASAGQAPAGLPAAQSSAGPQSSAGQAALPPPRPSQQFAIAGSSAVKDAPQPANSLAPPAPGQPSPHPLLQGATPAEQERAAKDGGVARGPGVPTPAAPAPRAAGNRPGSGDPGHQAGQPPAAWLARAGKQLRTPSDSPVIVARKPRRPNA
jgi:hypothetical protein